MFDYKCCAYQQVVDERKRTDLNGNQMVRVALFNKGFESLNKYKNRRITVNGITYDSKKEYRRHYELMLMERSGMITNLERQVKYVLIPSQRINGKVVERELAYRADFRYTQGGETVVEDVKGFKTPEYKIKKKLMLYFHGIQIKET